MRRSRNIFANLVFFFPISTNHPDYKVLSQFMRHYYVITHLHYAIDFNSQISYRLLKTLNYFVIIF
jgi:hypothetical protein